MPCCKMHARATISLARCQGGGVDIDMPGTAEFVLGGARNIVLAYLSACKACHARPRGQDSDDGARHGSFVLDSRCHRFAIIFRCA